MANILFIDGIPYPIGARVRTDTGLVGVITGHKTRSADDKYPLKVDFIGEACRYCGPYAPEAGYRITLADPITYPERPEALRRAGPEWGGLGTLEDEHNVVIDGEIEPEAYTLDS